MPANSKCRYCYEYPCICSDDSSYWRGFDDAIYGRARKISDFDNEEYYHMGYDAGVLKLKDDADNEVDLKIQAITNQVLYASRSNQSSDGKN